MGGLQKEVEGRGVERFPYVIVAAKIAAPRMLEAKTTAQNRSMFGRLFVSVSTTATGVTVFSVKSWARPRTTMRNPTG